MLSGRSSSRKDELVVYLRKNLAKGYTLESLSIALIKQGYPRTAIDEAVKKMNEELAKKAPIIKEKPKITYEVFDDRNKPVKIKKNILKRIFSAWKD